MSCTESLSVCRGRVADSRRCRGLGGGATANKDQLGLALRFHGGWLIVYTASFLSREINSSTFSSNLPIFLSSGRHGGLLLMLSGRIPELADEVEAAHIGQPISTTFEGIGTYVRDSSYSKYSIYEL